jgi:archaellum component FlaC
MLSETIGDVNADALRQISELNGKVAVLNNDISVLENDLNTYKDTTDETLEILTNRLNNDISTKVDEII